MCSKTLRSANTDLGVTHEKDVRVITNEPQRIDNSIHFSVEKYVYETYTADQQEGIIEFNETAYAIVFGLPKLYWISYATVLIYYVPK